MAGSPEWIYSMGSDRQSLAAFANVYGPTLDPAAGWTAPEGLSTHRPVGPRSYFRASRPQYRLLSGCEYYSRYPAPGLAILGATARGL